MKNAIKLTKKEILSTVLEEMLYGLQNDNEFLYNSLWLGLFDNVERADFYREEKTLFIQNKDGEDKNLSAEEVDELIYEKISEVRNTIDESLQATNGGMIILIND